MDRPTRQYLMALMPDQRKPRRIPKKSWGDAVRTATRWWLVHAPDVAAARSLCQEWPSRVTDGVARIINTGVNR